MRIETMSIPPASQDDSLRAVLLRKLLMLILSLVGAALVVAIFLKQIHSPLHVLQVFLSDLMLGLIAGYSARKMFQKQMGLLRFSSACTAYICAEVLLGFFTGWQFGIGPLKIHASNIDWIGLGQLLVGVGTIALTLDAWQRPVEVVIAPAQKIVTALPRSRRQPVQRPRRARSAGTRVQPAPAVSVAVPVKAKRKRITRRKPRLQFSAEVENRCPYCLELIEPNDPRGTVECKICHTLHHADCWAITGTCQVPHLN